MFQILPTLTESPSHLEVVMRFIFVILFLVSFGSVRMGNENCELLYAKTLKCP